MTSNLPTLSYTNSKGNIVPVKVSYHAFTRLKERWESYYGSECRGATYLKKWLTDMFKKAEGNRLNVSKSKKLKRRAKRHGNKTLYFKADAFTFIVEDRTLVTVEISANGERHLNSAHALG